VGKAKRAHHLTSTWARRALRAFAHPTLLLLALCNFALATEIPLDQRRSGYEDLGRDTKAMQDDDTANPAQSMKGVAARYPAFDAREGRPVDLEQLINLERRDRQGAPPLKYESHELLALTVYLGRQSRGMPIAEATDPRLAPFIAQGRALFEQRQGQINMSCAQCHDDSWGKKLAGNVVPQAHPTGYPIYRLEWQGLGSLQRRLRNCIVGMRAEGYEFGAPDYVALELFLMQRARGMTIETPGVRP